MSVELSFVLSQVTRMTDGRTDRQTDGSTIRKTVLHTMQRGKNLNYAVIWLVGSVVCHTPVCE